MVYGVRAGVCLRTGVGVGLQMRHTQTHTRTAQTANEPPH